MKRLAAILRPPVKTPLGMAFLTLFVLLWPRFIALSVMLSHASWKDAFASFGVRL